MNISGTPEGSKELTSRAAVGVGHCWSSRAHGAGAVAVSTTAGRLVHEPQFSDGEHERSSARVRATREEKISHTRAISKAERTMVRGRRTRSVCDGLES
jgi:hypothetical protein